MSARGDFALILPVLNPGAFAGPMIEGVRRQSVQPARWLVLDSESDDGSAQAFRAAGAEVIAVRRAEFNHGSTRRDAVARCGGAFDLLIFMTQDALPAAEHAFEDLLGAFGNGAVGAAYGRQLPHPDSGPFGAHARCYNYPSRGHLRSATDIARLGLRAAFLSNSFAAYRTAALSAVGGFPQSVPLGEDMVVAARMLRAGMSIAYRAQACVFHSHDYSLRQDFERYRATGRFHAAQSWLLRELSAPEGEGARFMASELGYILRRAPGRLPEAFARTALRYLGYRMGRLGA